MDDNEIYNIKACFVKVGSFVNNPTSFFEQLQKFYKFDQIEFVYCIIQYFNIKSNEKHTHLNKIEFCKILLNHQIIDHFYRLINNLVLYGNNKLFLEN
ncbi:hypothetical protein HZS_3841 [Henneguya salminicola]|nr:hypothetical protein HZS_3841 [Henneguya salminicola]